MESKSHYQNGLTVHRTLGFFSFCFLLITSQALAQTDSGVSLINEASIRGHVRFLADDLLEGRAPGSRGDQLTQLYPQQATENGYNHSRSSVSVPSHRPMLFSEMMTNLSH